MIVHIGRRSIISWRSGISLIIVHVLSWVLIIARIGLPHHRVGSARSSWWKMLFLASSILTSIVRSISLNNSWKVAVFPPKSLLMPRRTAGPETVASNNTPRSRVVFVGDGSLAPYHRLHLLNVHGCDGAGVDHGLRSVRRGRSGFVTHEAGPLFGQANKFIVRGIEPRVDSVLEVGRGRNLRFLLLFGKHVSMV